MNARLPCWSLWFVTAGLGLVSAAPAAAASKEEIERELDRVYARPEFHQSLPDLRWLAQAIANLFRWLGDLPDTNPVLAWTIISVCIVLLILLLAHITWSIVSVFYVTRRKRHDGHALAEQRKQSDRYRQEALAEAHAGNYTAAIRLLFLSLVYAFEERGTLLFRPALTNREYLAVVSNRPELRRGLAVFVQLLDDNWYGERPTTEEHYAHCRDLYDTLRQQG
jgi:hypothetical protein